MNPTRLRPSQANHIWPLETSRSFTLLQLKFDIASAVQSHAHQQGSHGPYYLSSDEGSFPAIIREKEPAVPVASQVASHRKEENSGSLCRHHSRVPDVSVIQALAVEAGGCCAAACEEHVRRPAWELGEAIRSAARAAGPAALRRRQGALPWGG